MEQNEWRPDYENLKDIMRRYEPSDDDAQADWRAKTEEETRQHQKTEASAQRRIWPELYERRGQETGEKEEKEKRSALKRAYWLRAAMQIVSYGAILLLTPFITGQWGFYLLVLLLAVPVTAASLLLRPLGWQAWLLRAAIPLLPVEAWFALRYFAWNPGTTLGLTGLCILAGSLYYVIAVRDRGSAKRNPKPEAENTQQKQGLKTRWQTHRRRDKGEIEAKDGRRRRFLLFIVPLTCISLFAPALLGLGIQLRRPTPKEVSAFALESLEDDTLMVRRMNGAYEHLQADQWAQASRQEKLDALQALLDIETDDLGLDRFDLRDPAVLAAAEGDGHTGVPALLHTGAAKGEQRVRAICHLAWHLMQMTVFEDTDIRRLEQAAKDREQSRYGKYAAQWNNRILEVDHAG